MSEHNHGNRANQYLRRKEKRQGVDHEKYNAYMRAYMRDRYRSIQVTRLYLDMTNKPPRKTHIAVYLTELEIERLDQMALIQQTSRSEWAATVLRRYAMAEPTLHPPVQPGPQPNPQAPNFVQGPKVPLFDTIDDDLEQGD